MSSKRYTDCKPTQLLYVKQADNGTVTDVMMHKVTALAGMAKVSEPVLLKIGSDVVVKVRANTPVQDLLQQLEKACRDGRIVDHEGYDITQHYAQDLPGGEYQVITSAASKLVAGCCVRCQHYRACATQQGIYPNYGDHLQTPDLTVSDTRYRARTHSTAT